MINVNRDKTIEPIGIHKIHEFSVEALETTFSTLSIIERLGGR